MSDSSYRLHRAWWIVLQNVLNTQLELLSPFPSPPSAGKDALGITFLVVLVRGMAMGKENRLTC